MRKAYIILGSLALILGIVAYFVVFSPGTYEFTPSTPSSTSGTLSFSGLAGDSGSSSPDIVASSSSSTTGNAFASSTEAGDFSSNYAYPYIVNWAEDQNDFSITGAAMQGDQIAFAIKVQIGNIGGCVPLNLRLVADESGDLVSPDQTQFDFPDTQSCNGTPNAAYANQLITFTVASSTPVPYLFTTGGTSNQFFQVATSSDGSVQLTLPSTSG